MSDIKSIVSINNTCMQSYPCQHEVVYISENGGLKKYTLDGVSIWRTIKNTHQPAAFNADNWEFDHFSEYEHHPNNKIFDQQSPRSEKMHNSSINNNKIKRTNNWCNIY